VIIKDYNYGTDYPTSWSLALLEKLPVVQTSINSPHFTEPEASLM
jgi:hypothetical protein